jgi:hypothetical protein
MLWAVHYSPEDITHYTQRPSSFTDVHTDQGLLRFRTEIIGGPTGDTYLLFVGASTEPMEKTLHAFLQSLAWLIPSGVLLAAVLAWWMAGKALEPVAALATSARDVALSRLDRRLRPVAPMMSSTISPVNSMQRLVDLRRQSAK